MPDENSRISVIADDKRVVIDGIGLKCDIDPSDNLHALQWNPSAKVPGSIERKRGGGEGFRDFRLMQPYVEAWKVAKAKKDAEDAAVDELNRRLVAREEFDESLIERLPTNLQADARKEAERIAAEVKEAAER